MTRERAKRRGGEGAFRSLLVPLDFSAGSQRVLDRVGALPLARGAKVTLLHVVPRAFVGKERARATADARHALSVAARELASLRAGVSVVTRVQAGAASAEIARQAVASAADVIAMGRGGGRGLREVVFGSTAERVLRGARLPVLVVRLPTAGRYRRPLLALDVPGPVLEMIAAALAALPTPPPRLDYVHAFDVPYAGFVYPSLAGSGDDRSEFGASAKARLRRALAAAAEALSPSRTSAGPLSFGPGHVRHGSPRVVIPKVVERLRTDLLVLGTRGYRGTAYALLGTVAGDLLREVPCDVLVVPPSAPRRG